ncbi:MAG: hypothetical protein JXQ71_10085 [Verrucomicrobia bacterium]|nr:hypothetical protein [Verrucomicrobiota bacterium]
MSNEQNQALKEFRSSLNSIKRRTPSTRARVALDKLTRLYEAALEGDEHAVLVAGAVFMKKLARAGLVSDEVKQSPEPVASDNLCSPRSLV